MIKMISFNNFDNFDRKATPLSDRDAEKTAEDFTAVLSAYSADQRSEDKVLPEKSDSNVEEVVSTKTLQPENPSEGTDNYASIQRESEANTRDSNSAENGGNQARGQKFASAPTGGGFFVFSGSELSQAQTSNVILNEILEIKPYEQNDFVENIQTGSEFADAVKSDSRGAPNSLFDSSNTENSAIMGANEADLQSSDAEKSTSLNKEIKPEFTTEIKNSVSVKPRNEVLTDIIGSPKTAKADEVQTDPSIRFLIDQEQILEIPRIKNDLDSSALRELNSILKIENIISENVEIIEVKERMGISQVEENTEFDKDTKNVKIGVRENIDVNKFQENVASSQLDGYLESSEVNGKSATSQVRENGDFDVPEKLSPTEVRENAKIIEGQENLEISQLGESLEVEKVKGNSATSEVSENVEFVLPEKLSANEFHENLKVTDVHENIDFYEVQEAERINDVQEPVDSISEKSLSSDLSADKRTNNVSNNSDSNSQKVTDSINSVKGTRSFEDFPKPAFDELTKFKASLFDFLDETKPNENLDSNLSKLTVLDRNPAKMVDDFAVAPLNDQEISAVQSVKPSFPSSIPEPIDPKLADIQSRETIAVDTTKVQGPSDILPVIETTTGFKEKPATSNVNQPLDSKASSIDEGHWLTKDWAPLTEIPLEERITSFGQGKSLTEFNRNIEEDLISRLNSAETPIKNDFPESPLKLEAVETSNPPKMFGSTENSEVNVVGSDKKVTPVSTAFEPNLGTKDFDSNPQFGVGSTAEITEPARDLKLNPEIVVNEPETRFETGRGNKTTEKLVNLEPRPESNSLGIEDVSADATTLVEADRTIEFERPKEVSTFDQSIDFEPKLESNSLGIKDVSADALTLIEAERTIEFERPKDVGTFDKSIDFEPRLDSNSLGIKDVSADSPTSVEAERTIEFERPKEVPTFDKSIDFEQQLESKLLGIKDVSADAPTLIEAERTIEFERPNEVPTFDKSVDFEPQLESKLLGIKDVSTDSPTSIKTEGNIEFERPIEVRTIEQTIDFESKSFEKVMDSEKDWQPFQEIRTTKSTAQFEPGPVGNKIYSERDFAAKPETGQIEQPENLKPFTEIKLSVPADILEPNLAFKQNEPENSVKPVVNTESPNFAAVSEESFKTTNTKITENVQLNSDGQVAETPKVWAPVGENKTSETSINVEPKTDFHASEQTKDWVDVQEIAKPEVIGDFVNEATTINETDIVEIKTDSFNIIDSSTEGSGLSPEKTQLSVHEIDDSQVEPEVTPLKNSQDILKPQINSQDGKVNWDRSRIDDPFHVVAKESENVLPPNLRKETITTDISEIRSQGAINVNNQKLEAGIAFPTSPDADFVKAERVALAVKQRAADDFSSGSLPQSFDSPIKPANSLTRLFTKIARIFRDDQAVEAMPNPPGTPFVEIDSGGKTSNVNEASPFVAIANLNDESNKSKVKENDFAKVSEPLFWEGAQRPKSDKLSNDPIRGDIVNSPSGSNSETVITDGQKQNLITNSIEADLPMNHVERNVPVVERANANPQEIAGPNFERFLNVFPAASEIRELPTKSVIENREVIKQIEPKIIELAQYIRPNEEKQLIKLRLNPAELGEVDVRIERDSGGNISAHIKTSNETARNILAESLGQLRDALQNSGLRVEGLEVSSNPYSSNGNENRDQQSRRFEHVEKSGVDTSTNDAETEAESQENSAERLVNLRA